MALRWKGTLKDRDATDEALWLNRRALLGGAAGLGVSPESASRVLARPCAASGIAERSAMV